MTAAHVMTVDGSGLFLKNYLGTVSAVPRPRGATVHMESRLPYATSPSIDIRNCIKHLTEDDICENYKNSCETRKINQNGIKSKEHQHNNRTEDLNRIEYDDDEEKDKKKEKKWTLGGLFRRKCRKDADDSSDESGDGKRGFLSRRKSKRDRRKTRGKATASGFDVIIPQHKDTAVNGVGKTVDELWGNEDVIANGPMRFIHRHQPNGVVETKPKDTLQVPRNSRRDSNLSRNSSGGSGSLESRKGRKEVLARAEAKREQLRDGSSSDENESYHSSSSLNRLTADGRRLRGRHHKRLSREEETLKKENDFRVVKSDFETQRLPPNSRCPPRSYFPDLGDPDKLNLINHSATPSPARSPRVRQKQPMPSLGRPSPNSYPVSTFPPGIHYPQGRTKSAHNDIHPSSTHVRAKDPQIHISQPLITVNYRKNNRNSEYIQPSKRSSSEHPTNRKTLMDYEQFLLSCGVGKEKSLSYDQDIHRASYFKNEDVLAGRMPIAKAYGVHVEPHIDGRQIPQYDLPQRTPRSYDNGDSLPVRVGGSLPLQNYHLIQRSASGNSCNVHENSIDPAYNQTRSDSHQHVPIHSQSPDRLKQCVQYPQNGFRYPNYRTMTETVAASPAIVYNDAKEKFYGNEPGRAEGVRTNLNTAVPNLRYYADQNPRSRNPIHITYNPTPSSTHEQVEPTTKEQNSAKEAVTASDFWKRKDQENMMQLKKAASPLTKPPQSNTRSGSNSPRLNGIAKIESVKRTNDNPVRACKDIPVKTPEPQATPKQITDSSNLDDALSELETIYNSLRLGDEDPSARAERRDLPTTFKFQQPKNLRPVNDLPRGRPTANAVNSERHGAVTLRRSEAFDKVSDDMAYRRMNVKERTENKKYPSHSYLRSSPALSPVLGDNPSNLTPKSVSQEPDITYDDVVFRNLRHANSTLKIQDPQPPFGIPIGPIAPAPNSDYLHATPTERFRPTFTSSKVPDIVKDDLAFRNLRKDAMTANLPVVENPTKMEVYSLMQKKRAVRSLSANLYNLIQKESAARSPADDKALEKDCEKTQSLTDLSEKEGKRALEKRLKELKDEKNSKRAEFFELSKEQRRKRNSKSKLSWTELAQLNDNFESIAQVNTSTETLTEDKENAKVHQRLRVNGEDSSRQDPSKAYRSPVVELSKYPSAAPSSTLYSNPFRDPTPGSPLDESQLEDLLCALEKEAKTASEDLGRQLDQLDLTRCEDTERRRSVAEDNSEGPTEILDKLCSAIESEMPTAEPDVGELANEIIQITEDLMRRDRKQTFEVVSDLSEILREMDDQPQRPKDASFQEVYEYNCTDSSLTLPSSPSNSPGDIDREFEEIHQQTESVDDVDALVADFTSGREVALETSSFPRAFPNESSSKSIVLRREEGSPGSSAGEGCGRA